MTDLDLKDACGVWQSGRDGSSLIRGAARVVTGTSHYFAAPFIAAYDEVAHRDAASQNLARILLDALRTAEHHDASGWGQALGIESAWAGRGISSKTEHDEDEQIMASLESGRIQTALWGVSLDPAVSEGYGSRFTFELVGDFPAVPAWVASGVLAEQRELIVGGTYDVVGLEHLDTERTHVRLRFVATIPTIA